MNPASIHVNFAPVVPRTIWYRSDGLPVILAAVFALVAIALSFIGIQPSIANIREQDMVVKESHTRLVTQTSQIQAELDAVNQIQKSRDTVLAARQSGLVVAEQIVSLGNSLGNDGVASRINSKGELAGIARDFPSLTKIWNRLGPNYAVTVADPAIDGSVNFTIEAVTALPTPVPLNNSINAIGSPINGANAPNALATPAGALPR